MFLMAHLKQVEKFKTVIVNNVFVYLCTRKQKERELMGEQRTHKVWPTQDELYTSKYLANLIQENYRGR